MMNLEFFIIINLLTTWAQAGTTFSCLNGHCQTISEIDPSDELPQEVPLSGLEASSSVQGIAEVPPEIPPPEGTPFSIEGIPRTISETSSSAFRADGEEPQIQAWYEYTRPGFKMLGVLDYRGIMQDQPIPKTQYRLSDSARGVLLRTWADREYRLETPARPPATFDVHHQMRCIGPTPEDLDLSLLFGAYHKEHVIENYPTPRSLCAKAIYGGNAEWNAGGFCSSIPPGINIKPPSDYRRRYRIPKPALFFEQESGRRTPEVEMFCSLRCRCFPPETPAHEVTYRIEGSERQPPDRYDANKIMTISREALEVFKLDQVIRPELPGTLLRNFGVLNSPEPVVAELGVDIWSIVPKPEWRPFRAFAFQVPRWISTYMQSLAEDPDSLESVYWKFVPDDMRKICTAHWYDNGPENAGFFCENTELINPEYRLTYREWLAHPSTLPSHQPYGLAIHLLCRSQCFCNDEERDKIKINGRGPIDVPLPYWEDHDVIGRYDSRDGTMSLLIRDSGDSTSPTRQIVLGSDAIPNGHADSDFFVGPCGHYPAGNCTGTWPTDILPIPGRPPTSDITTKDNLVKAGKLESQAVGKCGVECTGFADCASTREDPCRCVINPSKYQLRAVGVMDWAPSFSNVKALCVPLVTFGIRIGQQSSQRPARLGGRGLGKRGAEESICRCNETVAGPACCEDGQVGVDATGTFLIQEWLDRLS